jgi:hypothetical protein
MTKEPTHPAAGDELKSGIPPCRILREAGAGKAQQFILRFNNQNASGRFASGPKGI